MQARYYDPVIGRFYSNDPVDALGHMQRGNPVHGFGRHTYANNNPYRYTDPDGRAPIEQIEAAIMDSALIESNGDYGAANDMKNATLDSMGDAALSATGVTDVVDAVQSLSNGEVAGAAMSMAAAVVKPAKALKVLNSKQLKKLGIDAEAFKADEVGSRAGAKFNISADRDGNISLTPVKKGSIEPVPTNSTLESAAEHYPLDK
ncbi:RHS repeat-associated core domain-containing protein [Alteromonas sp.]|uniref:RHS repeat-associated core domain-containing protein n=1 Tax=Alteromonas sp. TaxID=232 RepID=UPI00257D1A78|nr:RHS repeat-associated core domain-containing protein [Alteromonas sp.]|tara:strand:+ start:23191 stop:23802 length:612 start_codon:yes stop_codon:yes gene_type:complete